MKIYTKVGDDGSCALASGDRVKKSSLRINAYGDVDELNSWIGYCRSLLSEALARDDAKRVDLWLSALQHDLFVVGSDLATPVSARFEGQRIVEAKEACVLEHLIDSMQNEIPQMRCFVLPAGTALGSALHYGRTICRRSERVVVALRDFEEINPEILPFLNRLSDFLFVLARWVQHAVKCGDVPWDQLGGLRTILGEGE
jgi:cob(I)alamin adenosyltransferase